MFLLPDFQDITCNQFIKLASQLQGHQQIADYSQAVTPAVKPFPPILKLAATTHTPWSSLACYGSNTPLRKGLYLVPATTTAETSRYRTFKRWESRKSVYPKSLKVFRQFLGIQEQIYPLRKLRIISMRINSGNSDIMYR